MFSIETLNSATGMRSLMTLPIITKNTMPIHSQSTIVQHPINISSSTDTCANSVVPLYHENAIIYGHESGGSPPLLHQTPATPFYNI